MVPPLVPGRPTLVMCGAGAIAVLVALLAGVDVAIAGRATLIGLSGLIGAMIVDYAFTRRGWRRATVTMARHLPAAFAIGSRRAVRLTFANPGTLTWTVDLHDYVDPTFRTEGLPVRLTLPGGSSVETTYSIVPTARGEVMFEPADARVRSRWRLCELLERIGGTDRRRVYPDFSQVARYAWLAGDHRLQEIGIKTYQLRGQGTDFKQLSEYRVGDSVRHIDWRATMRLGKPIVREYQDERDQCVMLLVDCGRRMRADDRVGAIGTTHFDQVLNAVMLLSYVALRQGDAVGAMTFGTPTGQERSFAPRKGEHALNALMGQLYGVQPTPTHSDYVAVAQDVLRRHRKRSLVIVITNFRDEDSAELGHALQLLRPRHLVLLASLRERVVRELQTQAMSGADAPIDVASAHLYEQSRRDAFNRLAKSPTLMVDAEPERLGVELVNRYHALKRAGRI
jgi:uncharacterized protein (DUF58 family)